jgi:hypothetical protein
LDGWLIRRGKNFPEPTRSATVKFRKIDDLAH